MQHQATLKAYGCHHFVYLSPMIHLLHLAYDNRDIFKINGAAFGWSSDLNMVVIIKQNNLNILNLGHRRD